MRVSIVIRTYNESRYLGRLLGAIDKQDDIGGQVEIVLVDEPGWNSCPEEMLEN